MAQRGGTGSGCLEGGDEVELSSGDFPAGPEVGTLLPTQRMCF